MGDDGVFVERWIEDWGERWELRARWLVRSWAGLRKKTMLAEGRIVCRDGARRSQ